MAPNFLPLTSHPFLSPPSYILTWILIFILWQNNDERIFKRKRRWDMVKYRKFPKFLDTQTICCNYPKSWTKWLFLRVMHPKMQRELQTGAVWSGSALFAQACPSENLGKYVILNIFKIPIFNLIRRYKVWVICVWKLMGISFYFNHFQRTCLTCLMLQDSRKCPYSIMPKWWTNFRGCFHLWVYYCQGQYIKMNL